MKYNLPADRPAPTPFPKGIVDAVDRTATLQEEINNALEILDGYYEVNEGATDVGLAALALIANAPDLLHECRKLVEQMEHVIEVNNEPDIPTASLATVWMRLQRHFTNVTNRAANKDSERSLAQFKKGGAA